MLTNLSRATLERYARGLGASPRLLAELESSSDMAIERLCQRWRQEISDGSRLEFGFVVAVFEVFNLPSEDVIGENVIGGIAKLI